MGGPGPGRPQLQTWLACLQGLWDRAAWPGGEGPAQAGGMPSLEGAFLSTA